MNRIKSTIIFLLMLLSTALFASDIDKERYKNYQFFPVYGNEATMSEASEILSQYLAEWRTVHRLYGAARWNDKLAIAYTTVLKDKYYSEWRIYKEERVSKGLKFDTSDWSAVAIFAGHKYEKNLEKKVTDLFPNGHYANDYYGCIELKPLFTAKMIGDSKDPLFSITGIGSVYTDGINDRLTLSIYGPNLHWSIRENLFLANYSAHIFKNPKYKFNYYAFSQELDQEHPLAEANKDNRGRKKYAKMFVADFNEDGLLEVLFWHRQYYSTLIKDKSKNGFTLEKQWFTYYVESEKSKAFIKQNIDETIAKKLLSSNELKWRDGYPKNNRICKDKGHSPYPMMPLILNDDIK